jgi:hypothetical protein
MPTSNPIDPIDQRYVSPYGGGPVPEEAAPFYSSVSTELVITTPSGSTTFYAQWTRIPIAITTSPSPAVDGSGFDQFALSYPTGTDCYFLCVSDATSDYAFYDYRDPQKQRPKIIATDQFITAPLPGGGTTGRSISPPEWFLDAGPLYRNPYRYFGNVSAKVDSNSFTAAQWRDMRGTYTASYTSGSTTFTYTWVIG